MRAKYGKKLKRLFYTQNTQPIQLLDMGPDMFDAHRGNQHPTVAKASTDVPTAFTATTLESNFDTYTGDIAEYLKDNGGSYGTALEATVGNTLPADRPETQNRRCWQTAQGLGYKYLSRSFKGCNKAFVIDEAKCEELVAADPSQPKSSNRFCADETSNAIMSNGRDYIYWQPATIWIFQTTTLLSTIISKP